MKFGGHHVSELPLPFPSVILKSFAAKNGVIFKSKNVFLDLFSVVSGNITVGDNCFFGYKSRVQVKNGALRIKDEVEILSRCRINESHPINSSKSIIGYGTVIGEDCHLDVTGDLIIGDGCLFSDHIHVYTHRHEIPPRNTPVRNAKITPEKVTIENDVFIGIGAKILSGVKIGPGTIIAAGTIVTKSVEPNSVVAGIPAKKIGERPE